MVNKLTQFVTANALLCVAFVVVVVLLLIEEFRAKAGQRFEIKTGQLVQWINNPAQVVQTVGQTNQRAQPLVIIDIRAVDAYRQGHIIGAVNIPSTAADKTLDKFSAYKNRAIVLTCQQGPVSLMLAKRLKKQSFDAVYVLSEGISGWTKANLPLVTDRPSRKSKSNKTKAVDKKAKKTASASVTPISTVVSPPSSTLTPDKPVEVEEQTDDSKSKS